MEVNIEKLSRDTKNNLEKIKKDLEITFPIILSKF